MLTILLIASVQQPGFVIDGQVNAETVIEAPAEELWAMWTTPEGLSFFAPGARVDLAPLGRYEIIMLPDAPEGEQGSDGAILLALEAGRMLSFLWRSPPSLPETRAYYTHVTLRFEPVDETHTRVTLVNDGYGTGPGWAEAETYFERAWPYVLDRMRTVAEGQTDAD
ncbi:MULTISPECIES: SRPBCC family protein [Hyphobacterium]|uniref:SRPBCC domain-containing protein n=1 Tax=Hyphobacterium vulgare TaxID=1736751 RepID=A0ABV6ZW90_9PROT